jgi:DNA repair protein RecO
VKARTVVTDAIVLRRVAWGDTDLVVHLLTRECGRIGAFARGARGSRRRYRGGLDTLSAVRVTLTPRGEGLWPIQDSEALLGAAALGASPERAAGAAVVAEVLDLSLAEGQGSADLFDRVARFLAWVADPAVPPARARIAVHRMLLLLLDEHGAAPDFARDAATGQPWHSGSVPTVTAHGDVVDASGRSVEGTRLSPAAATYLATLAEGRFPDVAEAARIDAGEVLRQIWERLLQRELRAWSVWRALQAPAQG